MEFSSSCNIKRTYALTKSGQVRFADKEVQAVQACNENTLITLENGKSYLLLGRNYGV